MNEERKDQIRAQRALFEQDEAVRLVEQDEAVRHDDEQRQERLANKRVEVVPRVAPPGGRDRGIQAPPSLV